MKKETDCSFETEAAMLAENLLAISEKLRIAQQKFRMLQRLYTTARAAYPGEGCCHCDRESEPDWCLRVPDFCKGREREANENG